MLVALSIRDVVLIDRLELELHSGLCVLTGETGAGKSILLDALGLALGARADSGLVRHGADQAVVTASFELSANHPAWRNLTEQGIEKEDALVLRRVLSADGRSRAFVNDQSIGISLLRRIGEMLVEIQGHFAQRGLLDAATHRVALDSFGRLDGQLERVRVAFRSWQDAVERWRQAESALIKARADEDFVSHALQELKALEPRLGEETELGEQRAILKHREKLIEALNAAYGELTGSRGIEDCLRAAARELGRVIDKAGGRIEPILAALDRAIGETVDAVASIEALGSDIGDDPGALERLEDRLFALRDVARKHRCEIEELPGRLEELERQFTALEARDDDLKRLAEAMDHAHAAYESAASELRSARQATASDLDRAIKDELHPLKLEKTSFRTQLEKLEDPAWGPDGMDKVTFEVSTNPGMAFGPLGRIASAGELSRIMLALKVILSKVDGTPTLVFDEVDSGIGGAVAAAVGQRLARLATETQILVVTHSPQVAARGTHHWRVAKTQDGTDLLTQDTVTRVDELGDRARREEIARMLSGSRITDEARAAADSLIEDERSLGGGA